MQEYNVVYSDKGTILLAILEILNPICNYFDRYQVHQIVQTIKVVDWGSDIVHQNHHQLILKRVKEAFLRQSLFTH